MTCEITLYIQLNLQICPNLLPPISANQLFSRLTKRCERKICKVSLAVIGYMIFQLALITWNYFYGNYKRNSWSSLCFNLFIGNLVTWITLSKVFVRPHIAVSLKFYPLKVKHLQVLLAFKFEKI